MVKTSYQNVRSFIILRSGEGFKLPLIKISVLTFPVKIQKLNEAFRGIYFLRIRKTKTFKSNLVLVVVLVLESKGLYHLKTQKKVGELML